MTVTTLITYLLAIATCSTSLWAACPSEERLYLLLTAEDGPYTVQKQPLSVQCFEEQSKELHEQVGFFLGLQLSELRAWEETHSLPHKTSLTESLVSSQIQPIKYLETKGGETRLVFSTRVLPYFPDASPFCLKQNQYNAIHRSRLLLLAVAMLEKKDLLGYRALQLSCDLTYRPYQPV